MRERLGSQEPLSAQRCWYNFKAGAVRISWDPPCLANTEMQVQEHNDFSFLLFLFLIATIFCRKCLPRQPLIVFINIEKQ